MSVREAYESSLLREGHERDPAQEVVVRTLATLQQRLEKPQKRRLRHYLGRAGRVAASASPGVYIWGGVGRGKTFIMDLFFEALAVDDKKRVHFHRMMHEVHDRLGMLRDVEDPLERVAADIAAEARVLCFDEFFVSDIGDAMILARLLEGLFSHGVVLVATSNSRPDDLYRNGLQRQRFLPAIETIKSNMDIVHMQGDTDYRLRLLQEAGTYLAPDDGAARDKLQHFFSESATSQVSEDQVLEINGRDIRARHCAKGIAWFEFAEICDGPRSQNDYIEIARWYPAVIVSGIPHLDRHHENQARRFIALVDEFYDRRVKLIVSAVLRNPVGFRIRANCEPPDRNAVD